MTAFVASPVVSLKRARPYEALKNDPLAVKVMISPERYQDFHTNKKILIVDDNADTAKRLHRDLSKLYDTVEVSTDPEEAKRKILTAKRKGVGYDLVVLDLFMPDKTGVELMKELGNDLPAVVVNTASMMSEAVLDLRVAIDDYTSAGALKIYKQYEEQQVRSKIPVVPIFTHHKQDSLATMVDKIDAAMLVARHCPNEISAFLEGYNPILISPVVSAEIVHSFCEGVRNLLADVLPVIEQVKKEFDLEKTSWWKLNGEAVDGSIAVLQGVTFANTFLDNPTLTAKRLHDILFHVSRLAGPSFSEEDCPEMINNENFGRTAIEWTLSVEEYQTKLQNYREALNEKNSPVFSMAGFFRGNFGIGDYYNLGNIAARDHSGDPGVPDPDRMIRETLARLVKKMQSRYRKYSAEMSSLTPIVVRYFPEDSYYREREDPALRKRLGALNIGSYYDIEFIDNTTKPLDPDLLEIIPDLLECKRRGLLTWSFEEKSVGCNHHQLNIHIKVSEQSIDFDERQRKKEAVDESGHFIIPTKHGDYDVHIGRGLNKNLVVVGRLPEELLNGFSIRSPMLFRVGERNEIVFSCGDSHYNSSGQIGIYLGYIFRKSGDEREAAFWSSQRGSEYIYKNGVRLSVRQGVFYVEASSHDPDLQWTMESLKELGIEEDKIAMDSSLGERAV